MSFAEPVPGVHGEIDAAYHAKYDRHGPEIVGTVVGRKAEEVTIRLWAFQNQDEVAVGSELPMAEEDR